MRTIDELIEDFRDSDGGEFTPEEEGVYKLYGLDARSLRRRKKTTYGKTISGTTLITTIQDMIREIPDHLLPHAMLAIDDREGDYGPGSAHIETYVQETDEEHRERIEGYIKQVQEGEDRRGRRLRAQYEHLKQIFGQEEADGAL